MTPEEWRRIVADLQAGVNIEEAFRKIFDEYFPVVQQYLQWWRFRPDEAEDLAQEALANVFKGIRSFKGESALKTWVIGVAKSVGHNELRKRSAKGRLGREVPLEEASGGPGSAASFESLEDSALDTLLEKEKRDEVIQRARRDLPAMTLRCFLLWFDQGRKYHDIAVALRISNETARWHVHEAKKRLLEKPEGDGDHEG